MKHKDGDQLRLGIDTKTLTNIAFDTAVLQRPEGDKLYVVMTLTLQPAKDLPTETLVLTVKAEQFAALAQVFARKAGLVKARIGAGTGPRQ